MDGKDLDFDFVVVGSGFGGSVSALRLAEKGYRVAVLEMGKRWTPENMPRTNWNLRSWIWRPNLGLRGFFNMRFFKHVTVLHGCAVGGGSITYANTLLVPGEKVWDMGSWKGLADWKSEMPSRYELAGRMLGVAENRILGPGDHLLKRVADAAGVGDTFYRTSVGVFQPREGEAGGKTYPDPYFGGEGPARTTCIGCGGCMMGCRYGAKNTLDLNYLYLAEKRGARVFAETKVVDVRPIGGTEDGADGYEVRVAGRGCGRARFTCKGIVFSASALGTLELLFDLKDRGSLPRISEKLGERVRTNSESLVGVRIPGSREDLSQGIAIGSGVYIDEHTHIEATRYPAGSDAMALLATLMTAGAPGPLRVLLWLKNLLMGFVTHPVRTYRAIRPRHWAREMVIFLCMQAQEAHVTMRWKRAWFWPFSKRLQTEGAPIPTFIPAANDFATKAAKLVGGQAVSMISEILFNVPGTAHILGGCGMGTSAENGVVDSRHRVFGYRDMYVCDGSVVSANLGVNPSLTICALTERAMGFIPAKR